jgi:hypothetical protein
MTDHSLKRTRDVTASLDRRGATVALGATACSVVSMLVLLVGDLAGWNGFDDSSSSTANTLAWSAWVLSGLLALGAGAGAWQQGRVTGSRWHCRAGLLALAYVTAVIVAVTVSAI